MYLLCRVLLEMIYSRHLNSKKLLSKLGKRFLIFELEVVRLISTLIPFKKNSKTLLNNLNLELPPLKSNPNKNKIINPRKDKTTKKDPRKTKVLTLDLR